MTSLQVLYGRLRLDLGNDIHPWHLNGLRQNSEEGLTATTQFKGRAVALDLLQVHLLSLGLSEGVAGTMVLEETLAAMAVLMLNQATEWTRMSMGKENDREVTDSL